MCMGDIGSGPGEGMVADIEPKYQESVWLESIDYWKLIFHHFSCRKVGHILKECENNEQGMKVPKNIWVNKTRPNLR